MRRQITSTVYTKKFLLNHEGANAVVGQWVKKTAGLSDVHCPNCMVVTGESQNWIAMNATSLTDGQHPTFETHHHVVRAMNFRETGGLFDPLTNYSTNAIL